MLALPLAVRAVGAEPEVEAQVSEGERLMTEALEIQTENPSRARELMEAAAQAGHVEALDALATFLAMGIGGKADTQRAAELREQAAAAGSLGARLNLGLALIRSDLMEEQRRGVALLDALHRESSAHPAAAAVKSLAAGGLGVAHVFGQGTVEDVARGVAYLLEADAGGVADNRVLYFLGRAFEGAWPGTEVDLARSRDYFRRSAEEGFPPAQWRHAVQLLEANPPREDEAYRWARAAAEAGSPEAMISTAVMLATGQGVGEDDREARAWYERAVREARSAHALRGLGAMLLSGEGGPTDVPRGLAFLHLALRGGDGNARAILESVEPRIGAKDRRKAVAIAERWIEAHGEPRHGQLP